MKKAVIATGGKQYLVAEGETLEVELLKQADLPAGRQGKIVQFTPLLTIDGEKITVGAPEVEGAKVSAEVTEKELLADKITSIRYKSKKRVHKVRGHRQRHAVIKITKIS